MNMSNIIEGVTHSLEELRQNYDCTHNKVAITINLPRTKSFVAMQSKEQCIFLKRVFTDALQACKLPYIAHYRVTFESCKDGNMHLHALVYSEIPKSIMPEGLVMDYVRNVYNQFKSKHLKMKYSSKWIRCSSPMCVAQFIDNPSDYDRWVKYMYKTYV